MEDNNSMDSINQRWLQNIYDQLNNIQEMERLAREGCNSLVEYMQVPPELMNTLLPTIQYKNLKFLVLELDMLIDNISPIIKTKEDGYKTKIRQIINIVNDRKRFLKDIKNNNRVVMIEVLPFFDMTLNIVIMMKAEIIKDIGQILYVGEKENKKTW